MRYTLGPVFSYTPIAPGAAPTSPTGKADPQITHKAVAGNVATFTVPPYALATSNRLMEVRLYLVAEGDLSMPSSGPAYAASSLPFGHADVSGLQSGGDVPITLPNVAAGSAYHAQYVTGYES